MGRAYLARPFFTTYLPSKFPILEDLELRISHFSHRDTLNEKQIDTNSALPLLCPSPYWDKKL